MMQWLFKKRLVREIKAKDGRVVFRRWQVFKTRWFQVLVHAVYDYDRDIYMHDHPWNFTTFILKGGYEEDFRRDYEYGRMTCRRVRKPFSITHMKAYGDYHRIRRLLNGTSWSLVVTGKRLRNWGYVSPAGWLTNQTYRELKSMGFLGETFSISPSKHD